MKSQERRVAREIRQLRRGQQPTQRRGKWSRLEAKIVQLRTQYEGGQRTLQQT